MCAVVTEFTSELLCLVVSAQMQFEFMFFAIRRAALIAYPRADVKVDLLDVGLESTAKKWAHVNRFSCLQSPCKEHNRVRHPGIVSSQEVGVYYVPT